MPLSRVRPACAVFVALLLLCACGSDDPGAPSTDEYEAELWPSTHLLDEDSIGQVTTITDEAVTFVAGSEIAAALAYNHVLLAGQTGKTPLGMLRRVTAVESAADGTTVVRTAPTVLQHAFRKLHVRSSGPLRLAAGPTSDLDTRTGALAVRRLAETDGESVGPFELDYFVFNGDGDESTYEDQVHVLATFGGRWEYQLGVDLEWPDLEGIFDALLDLDFGAAIDDALPEVIIGFSVTAGSQAALELEGTVTRAVEQEQSLAQEPLGAILVGPLVFTVTGELLSRIEAGATSRFHLRVEADTAFGMGVQFSSKTGSTVTPPQASLTVPTPDVEIPSTVHLRVDVGAKLLLALYGVVGPHLTLGTYADLQADLAGDPCWNFDVGVNGELGVDIALFGFSIEDWSEPFDIASLEILDGACTEDTTITQSPDLCDPRFAYWSERVEDVVPRNWTNDDDHVGLDRTPDGGWLVSGSRLRALVKIATDGALRWARSFRLPEDITPEDLAVTTAVTTLDGGILTTLYPPSLIARMDAEGHVRWVRRPGLPFDAQPGPKAALEAPDGSLWVAGTFAPTEGAVSDVWLARLDRDGGLLWARRAGLATRMELPTALLAVGDDVLLVGHSFAVAQDPAHQSFALRIRPDGGVVWNRDVVGCENLTLRTALISRDGDLVLGGGHDRGGARPFLLKLKPADGAYGWSNEGQGPAGHVSGLVQLTDGGYLESGTWLGAGRNQLWIARTDSTGRLQWLKSVDDGSDDGLATIALTGEGGGLLAAYTEAGDRRGSLWLSRFGVRDGILPLDAAAGAVTDRPFGESPDPCVHVNDGTLSLAPLELALTPQELLEADGAPNVTALITD